MPVIHSTYRPAKLLSNSHIQTIFPARLRKAQMAVFFRENVSLADGDTLQLDWATKGHAKLAVILPGVVSSTQTMYVNGIIQRLHLEKVDSVYFHYRGSLTPNPNRRMYDPGCSDDLERILSHIIQKNIYREVFLIGFSMGGNIVLKYLGEKGGNTPNFLAKAVAISPPCDLKSCSEVLDLWKNRIYRRDFLSKMKQIVQAKKKAYPELLKDIELANIRSMGEWDRKIVVPLNHFPSEKHYYETCSSKYWIAHICLPTLILTAKDDPVLGEPCYPIEECAHHPYVTLELSEYGGHTGFMYNIQGPYYSEERTVEFIFGNPLSR